MKTLFGLTVIAALAVALFAGQPAFAQKGSLVIKGSDTMVLLGQAWAEEYMKSHPGVNISVTGGGSGVGIAAFINGTCDICQSSRTMKKKEIDSSKSRNREPYRTIVALDGLSFAVNSNSPVKTLTVDQIKGIYSGAISDWSQVGGKSGRIVVLSRDNNSGTYSYVKEVVLKGLSYRSDALFMPSTKAIQQEITNNPNAIGYGGEAYFRGKRNVQVLSVSPGPGKAAVLPTDKTVQSGKYPVSRPLQFYTNGKPSGVTADFVKFCLSPKGQALVTKVGYVPLP